MAFTVEFWAFSKKENSTKQIVIYILKHFFYNFNYFNLFSNSIYT